VSTPFNSVLVWEIQQYRSFHDKYTLGVNRRYSALSGKAMWDWDVRVIGMSQVKGITRPCKSPEKAMEAAERYIKLMKRTP